MTQFTNKYDLEDRTMRFSKNLIAFLKACPKNSLTLDLINQCLRAGTSIGANYREANGGSSKKDFYNKIYICKKEDCRILWAEAKEFVLIFGKIVAKSRV